jgi:hypothetical protein
MRLNDSIDNIFQIQRKNQLGIQNSRLFTFSRFENIVLINACLGILNFFINQETHPTASFVLKVAIAGLSTASFFYLCRQYIDKENLYEKIGSLLDKYQGRFLLSREYESFIDLITYLLEVIKGYDMEFNEHDFQEYWQNQNNYPNIIYVKDGDFLYNNIALNMSNLKKFGQLGFDTQILNTLLLKNQGLANPPVKLRFKDLGYFNYDDFEISIDFGRVHDYSKINELRKGGRRSNPIDIIDQTTRFEFLKVTVTRNSNMPTTNIFLIRSKYDVEVYD